MLEYDESKGVKAKRLTGNVGFKHEGALLYCDSAYLYSKTNSMDAWGNVRVKQGDTLNMYGDSLMYDGNTRLARLRGNVRVIDKDMHLTTDYLDYDRKKEMAYYIGGGKIISKKDRNNLTSNVGYYYPKTKQFFFKDSVVLINPEYEIRSDTLMYHTRSEVTWFYGPTTIKSKDNLIYCENGWYNTFNNTAQFNKNAWIESDNQRIEGDSIFYDRNKGIGEAFGNIAIIDTVQDIIITGDYTINNEHDSISLITGHAMLTQIFEHDSLFLHADTLLSVYDSTRQHKLMHAFHHVKFYKPGLQGKCDSLIFSDADSTIWLFRDPVLWADENQMTADHIEIRMFDGEIQDLRLDNNAFIVSEEDSALYNQIKGKYMFGYFKENKLYKIDVTGNGQTVYYATEEDGKMIGVNRADCSDLVIYVDSNKVDKILFLKEPSAILYPIGKAAKSEIILEGLNWRGNIRPRKKEDIFIWETVPVED